MLPKTLKNFTLFVDGEKYAGKVDEIELPKITETTENHLAGGMDAPIEIGMGLEAMEASMTFAEYDPALFSHFGLVTGEDVSVVARGAQSDGVTTQAIVVEMRGRWKELDPGNWKRGEKAALKSAIAIRYLKVTMDGTDVAEIDTENLVRIIGGIDQMQAIRTALGG